MEFQYLPRLAGGRLLLHQLHERLPNHSTARFMPHLRQLFKQLSGFSIEIYIEVHAASIFLIARLLYQTDNVNNGLVKS